MPYTPSTQRVGFRNRSIDTKAVTEANQLVKDLEANRKETVTGMKQYAADQTTEMTRISGLEEKRIAYENSNAKATVDSILNFGKEVVAPIAKIQVDRAVQKGIDTYRASEAGDEDALAKVKLNDEQIAQIDVRIEEQRKKTSQLGDQYDAIWEVERGNLIDKIRSENIRSMGANVQRGYRQAMLIDRAESYKAWRSGEIADSNDIVWFNKEQTIGAAVNTFFDQDADGQRKISAYLEHKFIKENGLDFTPGFVNKYLTKSIVSQTNKLEEAEHQVRVRDQAYKEYEALTVDFNAAVKNVEGDPDKLQVTLQGMLNRMSSIQRRMGTPGSSRLAAKKEILKMLADATSFLEVDSKADIEDMEDMYKFLDKQKFNIPWLGGKEMTLNELWGDEASTESLRSNTLTAYYSRTQKEGQALDKALHLKLGEAKKEYQAAIGRDDPDAAANYQATIKALQENDVFATANTRDTQFATAKTYVPDTISDKAAEISAERLLIDYEGTIPLKETTKWSAKMLDKYESQISTETFAFVHQKGSAGNKIYTEGLTRIAGTINQIYNDNNKQDRDQNGKLLANQYINRQIIKTAKAFKESNPNLTDEELLKKSVQYWNARLIADNDNLFPDVQGVEQYSSAVINDGITFKYSADQGFVDPLFGPTLPGNDAKGASRNIRKVIETTTDLVNNEDEDVIKNISLITQPRDLSLLPSATFEGPPRFSQAIIEIGKLDPLDRTLPEILNLQREKAGLPKLDWNDPEVDPTGTMQGLINAYNAQNPSIRKLLKNGERLGIDRAEHEMNRFSVHSFYKGVLEDTPLPETAFTKDLVAGAGLPSNMTYQEFLANKPAQIRAANYEINRLATIASGMTNDVNTMVRIVSTGLNYGEAEMGNWNSPEYEKLSLGSLNSYLSGSESKVDYFKDRTIAAVRPEDTDENRAIATRTELLGSEIPTNLLDMEDMVTNLEAVEPINRFRDGTVNPEYNQWRAKIKTIKAQYTVSKDLAEGVYPPHSQVRMVIGAARYREIINKYKFSREKQLLEFKKQPEFQLTEDTDG